VLLEAARKAVAPPRGPAGLVAVEPLVRATLQPCTADKAIPGSDLAFVVFARCVTSVLVVEVADLNL